MSSRFELPFQLGRYRLVQKLGEGGMGAVYLAEDSELGRRVAVKLPLLGSPEAIQRFRREARIAAAIEHPNVCPIHDIAAIDGTQVLVMSFIEGVSLDDYIQGNPPPQLELVTSLVCKIAGAVLALHERGLMHRDLKPANVMLKQGREPVVMDFGLARSFRDMNERMTKTGGVVGTLDYMSPEQLNGDESTGHATDMYSLGVILYELLTGRRPFEASSHQARCAQIFFAAPSPPSTYRPGLASVLDAICAKALAKKAGERYAGMAEFVAALQAAEQERQKQLRSAEAQRQQEAARRHTMERQRPGQQEANRAATQRQAENREQPPGAGWRSVIVGIDLGTSNSVVAVMQLGEVKVIPNQEGNRLTPSIVAFTDQGDRLVGDPAKRQAVTNPRRTISSIKRCMGRRYNEIQAEVKDLPYDVVGQANELVKVDIDGHRFTPPEISAIILRKLKSAAEAHLGHTVRKAVIAVPAYFNAAQRQATIDAAQIAGFDTEWELEDPTTGKKSKQRMRLISHGSAAALAYGLDKTKEGRIVVFDLGGGTLDISVLHIGDGVFEVNGVNGDTHLGGDNFDQLLSDHFAEVFKKESGVDLRKDQVALQRLKEAAERARRDLSQATTPDINLPFITADASGPRHLQMSLTRTKFEQLVDHLIERCRGPVLRALQDAGCKPMDIDEIVLVGGMTRVPKVQAWVKEIIGKEGHKGVNPDEVVAIGAAIQGAQLLLGSKSEVLLLDVTPLSLGIETLGGIMTKIIERNTIIPTVKKQTFSTAEDNQSVVTVRVFEGEREMAADNRPLGQLKLEGIAPASRGMPQIEVAFDLDANGILNVSVKDLGTGKEQRILCGSGCDMNPIDGKNGLQVCD